jgi:hypothetical protein
MSAILETVVDRITVAGKLFDGVFILASSLPIYLIAIKLSASFYIDSNATMPRKKQRRALKTTQYA